MRKFILGAALLLPSIAFGAGFAKDPVFLSRSPVTEGQTVRIFAVIENSDTTAFAGSVVFYDNGAKIGSVAESLAAGATQTASISWTPGPGSHVITASMVAKNGSVVEDIKQNFSIAAKPKPVTTSSTSAAQNTATQYAAATIDSSVGIQDSIANVSPQVASTTAPAFAFIDNARSSAAQVLDAQIASTKAKVSATPKPGIVAGTSTMQDVQIQNPTTGIWYWLYTMYLWILLVLRWLVGNAGVFYPFLAVAFLYILWRLYRRFKRPY